MTHAQPIPRRADQPEPGAYAIDPAHTGMSFVARHMMFTKVRGSFRVFGGTVNIDEVPERSRVDVSIDAASVDTGSADRDGHLRSPDFLDVERHPELRFRSTSLVVTGEDSFDLRGELTIRDVTRPVTLRATYDGAGVDPFGNAKAGFTASTEIDREDWGLTWNQALETGGVLVAKKVTIELDVQLVRQ